MNVSTEGLPPEMQQRIADIIEKAKAGQPQAQPQQERPVAPVTRPPTLMDHTVALRQEVAALRQELHAVAQVPTPLVRQSVSSIKRFSASPKLQIKAATTRRKSNFKNRLTTIDYKL